MIHKNKMSDTFFEILNINSRILHSNPDPLIHTKHKIRNRKHKSLKQIQQKTFKKNLHQSRRKPIEYLELESKKIQLVAPFFTIFPPSPPPEKIPAHPISWYSIKKLIMFIFKVSRTCYTQLCAKKYTKYAHKKVSVKKVREKKDLVNFILFCGSELGRL